MTQDPELFEKIHHQDDIIRNRKMNLKVARAEKFFKQREAKANGSKNPPVKKPKKEPATTEERAKKKTSLTRTLPAHAKIVQGPLLRQFQDDSVNGNGNMKTVEFTADDEMDLSMEMLNIFQGVSEKLLSGSSLGPFKADFVKLFSTLDEKNALFEAMHLLYEKHRLFPLLKARAHVTSYLIKCAQRQDLTPAEALAFYKIFGDESASIRASLKEFSAAPLKDVEALLEKIDSNDAGNLRDLVKQFAGTTPQGREIIRRVFYELKLKVDKAQAAEEKPSNENEPETESDQDPADQNQDSGKKEETIMTAEPATTVAADPECPPSTPPCQGTGNIKNTRPAGIFAA